MNNMNKKFFAFFLHDTNTLMAIPIESMSVVIDVREKKN
jgi:hypothetical protein